MGEIKVEGLETLLSPLEPTETMNRLETGIKAHGMTVFARINHAALAAEAGLALRPTEVFISSIMAICIIPSPASTTGAR
ncbi:hypothetical protein ACXR0O_03150 [Verrucomicrobiota bacterium sgz303538]